MGPKHAEPDEQDDWNRLFAGGATGGIENIVPTDLSGEDLIRHADDAVDYEGEDELADDDLPDEELPDEEPATGAGNDDFDDWMGDLSHEGGADYGEELTTGEPDADFHLMDGMEQLESELDQLEAQFVSNEITHLADDKSMVFQLLRAYYPDFTPGALLKMNTIFSPKPSRLILPKPKISRPCVPSRTRLEVEVDQKFLFKSGTAVPISSTDSVLEPRVINITTSSIETALTASGEVLSADKDDESGQKDLAQKQLEVSAADWSVLTDELDDADGEDSEDSDTPVVSVENATPGSTKRRRASPSRKPRVKSDLVRIYDSDNIYKSEDEDAFLEGTYRASRKKVRLDMNDPQLLFLDESQSRRMWGGRTSASALVGSKAIPTTETQLQSRYNISNDVAYDMLKENYQSKVRSTIGNLSIDHSMVALRLQSPHYKVKLSKNQLRSFHRPSFVVKPNTTIQFTKLKQRKKKKDKGKHISQLLAKTGDLTLGDTTNLFLLEYSEEFPLVLSNFGMGSKLINYYRKKSNEDAFRPKLPIGETHVLGVQDRSAFWNFGFVEPGKVVPTLYNRMIRAPIFKHEVPLTDFLLVRSTGGGIGGGKNQRYFLRSIPNLFVVGQTFPVTPIPGPHSRKVTTASKNRLKMVVYRVLNKSDNQRLQVRDISSHFPDQNDMQNRQRLKEFMEYQRSGDDQGYWKVKTGDILPPEDVIRSMITPEDIALLESMQVGQQHLEDAGYGKTVDDDKEDQDGMSIEEQLAPWNVSRNFINATQGKAMLQLHGDGDPTGRGEGFSFLRTSMKGGFKSMGESINDKLDKTKLGGHSYNVAMQQKAYDEDIKRIWYSQKKSLEITDTKDLKWDEAEHDRDEQNNTASAEPDGFHASDREDDDMSLFSHTSTSSRQNKVLRITRFVKDQHGVVQRRIEVVKDPNVIRAYVKRRQALEDAEIVPDDITVTNDEERNRRNRKRLEEEITRLQRNQDRRLARKAMKGDGVKGKAKATTRKCATCGAVGHIRTNKACPMYDEVSGGGAPNPQAAAPMAMPPGP